ncbi:hypothetical protein JCM10212_004340 [Sporobolomyces blumeae]
MDAAGQLADPATMTPQERVGPLLDAIKADDLLGVLLVLFFVQNPAELDLRDRTSGETAIEACLRSPTKRRDVRRLILETILHRGASLPASFGKDDDQRLVDVVLDWSHGGRERASVADQLVKMELVDAEAWIENAGLGVGEVAAMAQDEGFGTAQVTPGEVDVKPVLERPFLPTESTKPLAAPAAGRTEHQDVQPAHSAPEQPAHLAPEQPTPEADPNVSQPGSKFPLDVTHLSYDISEREISDLLKPHASSREIRTVHLQRLRRLGEAAFSIDLDSQEARSRLKDALDGTIHHRMEIVIKIPNSPSSYSVNASTARARDTPRSVGHSGSFQSSPRRDRRQSQSPSAERAIDVLGGYTFGPRQRLVVNRFGGSTRPYPSPDLLPDEPYRNPSDRPRNALTRDPWIHVSYLSPNATREDVHHWVASVLGRNAVRHVDLAGVAVKNIRNAEQEAIVVLRSVDDARDAILELDGGVLDGFALRVDAEPAIDATLRTRLDELLAPSIGRRSRVRRRPRRNATSILDEDLARIRKLGLSVADVAAIERIWSPLDNPPTSSSSDASPFLRQIQVTTSFGFVPEREALVALKRNESQPAYPEDDALQRRYEHFLKAQAGLSRELYTTFFAQLCDWNRQVEMFSTKGKEEAEKASRETG